MWYLKTNHPYSTRLPIPRTGLPTDLNALATAISPWGRWLPWKLTYRILTPSITTCRPSWPRVRKWSSTLSTWDAWGIKHHQLQKLPFHKVFSYRIVFTVFLFDSDQFAISPGGSPAIRRRPWKNALSCALDAWFVHVYHSLQYDMFMTTVHGYQMMFTLPWHQLHKDCPEWSEDQAKSFQL